MLAIGARVAAIEKIPLRLADLCALGRAECDAGLGDLAPLLADLFALFLGECAEKGVEVGVGTGGRAATRSSLACRSALAGARTDAVVPMKLHRVPGHEPSRLAGPLVRRREKEQVERGQGLSLAPGDQGPHQCKPSCIAAGQQARARNRGERYRAQGLGVVRQAMALVGVGPGPVKDVLAVGVVLAVEGAGRLKLISAPEGQKARRPADGSLGTAAGFQGTEVSVAHKGRGLVL